MGVVVTGSSGQVGSYVVDALQQRGHTVMGIDQRPSKWTRDVRDVRTVRTLADVDSIVHCAAQVSVPLSMKVPREDAAHNVDGTLAMLEAARLSDARFVFISSAAVYDPDAPLPVNEDAPVGPLSFYGLSKAVGERYARMYAESYGIPLVVLRPFNIFSTRQDPGSPYSGVISRFVAAVQSGEAPLIFGDGSATRDFVHARDVVQAILIALEHPEAAGGVFNVATGRSTSILELARHVMASAHVRGDIRFSNARPAEIPHSAADVTRLERLGFHPETNLDIDLAHMVAARRQGTHDLVAHAQRSTSGHA